MRFLTTLLILSAAAQDSLDHSKWVLQREGKAAKPPITLSFEGGRLSAKACNNQSGNYKIERRKIFAAQMISTRMACVDDLMQTDQMLAKTFAAGAAFQLNGNLLTLTGASGESPVFERQLLASASAKTKFVYIASTTIPCQSKQCLQYRTGKTGPWRPLEREIIGFEPVPGIEYRLRIKEDKQSNGTVWFYDLAVEQKIVDRAAAEAYQKSKP